VKPSQIDRAIAALLDGWLSPKQITAASGRANPNGIIRDARLEAARRGLAWEERWVRSAETGCRYKMHHLAERSVGAVNTARSDVSAGPRKGSRIDGRDSRPSPSRWQDRVGVSGAARKAGGEQLELREERG